MKLAEKKSWTVDTGFVCLDVKTGDRDRSKIDTDSATVLKRATEPWTTVTD
jgi:hypothetical protein